MQNEKFPTFSLNQRYHLWFYAKSDLWLVYKNNNILSWTILIYIRSHSLTKYMFNLFSSDCMFCTLVLWLSCNTSVFKTIYFWAPINSIIHFYGTKSNKPFKLCVQFEQDHKKVQNHLPSEELRRSFRLKNNNLGTKMQCNLEKYHPSCTRYPLGRDFKVP